MCKKVFIFKHDMTWKKSRIFPNTILLGFASCLAFGKHLFVSCCDAVYHVTGELEKRLFPPFFYNIWFDMYFSFVIVL